MERRAAVAIDPPPVPIGKDRCPCCDGPLGPKSWGIPLCITCWDAEQGRRTDPTVYHVQSLSGGWRIVKFVRKHTSCPLKALDALVDASGAGGMGAPLRRAPLPKAEVATGPAPTEKRALETVLGSTLSG